MNTSPSPLSHQSTKHESKIMAHYQIVIVGGGNAGISTASKLLLKNSAFKIAIIEPSDKHYYQPAWTLVGAGAYDINDTIRTEASVMPSGVEWIKDRAIGFQPEKNQVDLVNESVTYDYLIVCPGIQLNWGDIKGLPETLGKNNVCSNYSFQTAPYTFESLKGFKGGKILFHSPSTPIKCGGAPHKIMYLVGDYLRKHGLLDKTEIHYWSGGTRLFGVEKYEKSLLKVIERYGIKMHFKYNLTEIDGASKTAKFVSFDEKTMGKEEVEHFDMIHVTPPQSAPDFVKSSPLANAAGWVDIDKNTLQHVKYPNVFSLGDAAAVPTARTGAAIRKQSPVLVTNLMDVMAGRKPSASYNGYSSCPIVTGYGTLILAEFDYNNQPVETFPFDQSKERWTMYLLKREVLPRLYWTPILKGWM